MVTRDAWSDGLVGATVAGRYRLDGTLGVGGMGAVFAATHLGVGRRVAIKVLAPRIGRDHKATERFRQEAQLAASVARRGVVDVFDFDIDPAIGPFLVMEYLYGESLADRIAKSGTLDPAEAVPIVSSLLGTLAVIHAQGVLHRDLKPANIFLAVTPEGEEVVKVLDFGLARVAEALRGGPLTAPGLALGTPAYMSPEQLLGEPLDARADIYGVGGVLFAALTGRPPRLVGPDVGRIEDAPPVRSLRRELPPSLAAVVDRALVRQRTARFDSAAAMLEALSSSGVQLVRVSSGEPTVPTPIVLPQVAEPMTRELAPGRASEDTVAARPRGRISSVPAPGIAPASTAELPEHPPAATSPRPSAPTEEASPAAVVLAAAPSLFASRASGPPTPSPSASPPPSPSASPPPSPSVSPPPMPDSAPPSLAAGAPLGGLPLAAAPPHRRAPWLVLGIVIGVLVGIVVGGAALLFVLLQLAGDDDGSGERGNPPMVTVPSLPLDAGPPPGSPSPVPVPLQALSPVPPLDPSAHDAGALGSLPALILEGLNSPVRTGQPGNRNPRRRY